MLQATIISKDANFYECFKLEEMSYKRGSYTVKKKNNELIFQIQAKDPIALKTITNSICKLLEIKEKSRRIK